MYACGASSSGPVVWRIVDAERVAVDQQRQDVGHPAPDVGLPHAQLDLLVEHPHQGIGSVAPP